jgi:hypothetical protein
MEGFLSKMESSLEPKLESKLEGAFHHQQPVQSGNPAQPVVQVELAFRVCSLVRLSRFRMRQRGSASPRILMERWCVKIRLQATTTLLGKSILLGDVFNTLPKMELWTDSHQHSCFKSCHGKYLNVGADGPIATSAEPITWVVQERGSNQITLSFNGSYLSAVAPQQGVDRVVILTRNRGPSETWTVIPVSQLTGEIDSLEGRLF